MDDDRAVRRFVRHALTRVGCEVLEAGSAADALGIFEANEGAIDLVIVDFVMPGVSGLDLGAELGRLWPGCKILYTSGWMDSVALRSLAAQRPALVLSKPFTASGLVARVKELVEGDTVE